MNKLSDCANMKPIMVFFKTLPPSAFKCFSFLYFLSLACLCYTQSPQGRSNVLSGCFDLGPTISHLLFACKVGYLGGNVNLLLAVSFLGEMWKRKLIAQRRFFLNVHAYRTSSRPEGHSTFNSCKMCLQSYKHKENYKTIITMQSSGAGVYATSSKFAGH